MSSDSLSPLRQTFILHWGEMGNRWGINRSMAQIHALLLTAPEPLTAETITDLLGFARSNVSTSLRELQGWGIVRIQHQIGDRRDHFVTDTDPWVLFRAIARERRRREIDPTMQLLQQAKDQSASDEDPYTGERMAELLEFFATSLAWFDAIDALPTPALKTFLKAGPAVAHFLGATAPPKDSE